MATASSGAASKQGKTRKKSGGAKFQLPLLAVRFCAVYNKNPENAPCANNCSKLHACRRWIAGSCKAPDCKHSHSLLTPVNAMVLRKVGISLTPTSCSDNIRRMLRQIFPFVCYYYNAPSGCNNSSCSRLHICSAMILNNGNCPKAVHKQCSLNHGPSNEQLKPIWERFNVTWKNQKDIHAIYHDCIAGDERFFEQLCKCATCADRKSATAGNSDSEESDSGSSNNSSFVFKVSGAGASGVSNKTSASASAKKNLQESTTTDKAQTGSIRSLEQLGIRNAMHRSVLSLPSDIDPVSQMRTLIVFLIERGLVVIGEEIAKLFSVPSAPAFVKSLRKAAVFSPNLRLLLPISFEWENVHYVSLLNVFRICVKYNSAGGCKEQNCLYLHVCKLHVARACQSGPMCRLSHNLDSQPLFARLGCDTFSPERRLALVRISHPTVCEAYAFDINECRDRQCINMHICNDPVLGVPCRLPNCDKRKDHDPTSSRYCKVRLTRFGLGSESAAVVMPFFLPAPLQPQVSQSALPPQAAKVDGAKVRHVPSISSDSQASFSDNERNMATGSNFTAQLAALSRGNVQTSRTLTYAAVTNYLLNNELEVESSAIFRDFDTSFDDSDKVASLEKWLVAERKMSGVKASIRMRLPSLFHRDGTAFVSMLRLFRNCRNGRTCKGKCQYFHVCRLFIVGLCDKSAGAIDCPFGLHSSGLQDFKLLSKLGLEHLQSEQCRLLLRWSHPQVCSAYAYGTCENQQCRSLHCCNEMVLGRACRSAVCPYEHDLLSTAHNVSIVLRFGLPTSEFAKNLLLPVAPRSDLPQSQANINMNQLGASEADGSRPSAFGMHSLGDSLPHALSAPTFSNTLEFNILSPDPSAFTLSVDKAASQSEMHTVQDAVASKESSQLLVCERHLRGLCDVSTPTHSNLIHCERAFCWVFKLPKVDDAAVYMRRILPDARFLKTSDGSRWFLFAEKDNLLMEESFCNPRTRLLNRTVELTEPYPFAGDCQIVFGGVRDDSPFRMTARLKQLVASTGVGQKVAANFGRNDEPVVRLSKLTEMEVSCFRTSSYGVTTPNFALSTRWRWYFKSRDSVSCEEEWADCTKLVGENVHEIEFCYASGHKSVTLPAAEHCRPGGFSNVRKHYLFDFETMLVSCDEDGLQSDLCSRPDLICALQCQ